MAGFSSPNKPRTPAIPLNPFAVAGNASASVFWTAPPANGVSIVQYTISVFQNGVSITTVGGITGTSFYINSGLGIITNGDSSFFEIAADGSGGLKNGANSLPSNTIIPTTSPVVPGAPTSVTAVTGSGVASVTWSAPGSIGSASISSYNVIPYLGALSQTTRASGSPTTSYVATGLTNGGVYTFTSTAQNSAGFGLPSASSASVQIGVPSAPTGVSGSAGNGQATISWTASTPNAASVSGYIVDSYTSGHFQTSQTYNSTATSQIFGGLTNGSPYTFTVQGINVYGNSVLSTASSAITPLAGAASVPGIPTGVSATAANTSASVVWTAPAANGSAITSYSVVTYLNSSSVSAVATGSSSPSYNVTSLTNGSAYSFVVAATNSIGTGGYSTRSASVRPNPTVPGIPTSVVATAGNTAASITWTAPLANGASISSYQITPYLSGSAQSPINTGTTATAYTVGSLTNNDSYTFTVAATNSIGTSTPSSQSNSVTPTSGGGTAVPYATIPGMHTWTVLLQEEFNGSFTTVCSGITDTSTDTVSSSGLASGSGGLDRTVWTPWFSGAGGNGAVNNQTATYQANASVGGSILNLALQSGTNGACLFGSGSNTPSVSPFQAQESPAVTGHEGMTPFAYPALIEIYANFVESSSQNSNWPAGIYFIDQSGQEMDICEINDIGGSNYDFASVPGQCCLNLHGPGTTSRTQVNVPLGILTGWHVISTYWTSGYVDVYVDNVLIKNVSPDFSSTHTNTSGASLLSGATIIPILVVGGFAGGALNSSNSNWEFYFGGIPNTPTNYQWDWVHIFQG